MTNYSTGRIETYSEPQWLVTESCCNCSILFAIPKDFQRRAQNDPAIWWYCPNGHRQHYTSDTLETKLRNAEARNVALADQLESAAREAETVRVALLRDRQRFANGVCPCCNRSFENVRRHMDTKHPDYDVTNVAEVKSSRFSCSCGSVFESLHGLRVHQGRNRGDDWSKPSTAAWRAHLTKV